MKTRESEDSAAETGILSELEVTECEACGNTNVLITPDGKLWNHGGPKSDPPWVHCDASGDPVEQESQDV